MRPFVAAFVAGAWWLQREAALPGWNPAPLALALFLAAFLVPPRRVAARIVLLALCGALAGYGLAAWRAAERMAESLPLALEGEDLEIVGAIEQLPQLL